LTLSAAEVACASVPAAAQPAVLLSKVQDVGPSAPGAWQASLASAGFGTALPPASQGGADLAAVDSPFIFRKRPCSELSEFSLRASRTLVFNKPAIKKCIRQTMDLRGNYRPVAVDAAEVMAD